MRVVFRMSATAPGAIVAALAILAGGALAGCGQRGALYLPTVPPLPAKPSEQTQSSADAVKPDSRTASAPGEETIPDTSGTPLSLSPESDLHAAPGNPASAAQQPASESTPVQ